MRPARRKGTDPFPLRKSVGKKIIEPLMDGHATLAHIAQQQTRAVIVIPKLVSEIVPVVDRDSKSQTPAVIQRITGTKIFVLELGKTSSHTEFGYLRTGQHRGSGKKEDHRPNTSHCFHCSCDVFQTLCV